MAQDLPDVRDFIDQLQDLGRHPLPTVQTLFDFQRDIIVAERQDAWMLWAGSPIIPGRWCSSCQLWKPPWLPYKKTRNVN